MAIYSLGEVELSVEAGNQLEFFIEKHLLEASMKNDLGTMRDVLEGGVAETLEGKTLAVSISFNGSLRRLLIPKEEWREKRN